MRAWVRIGSLYNHSRKLSRNDFCAVFFTSRLHEVSEGIFPRHLALQWKYTASPWPENYNISWLSFSIPIILSDHFSAVPWFDLQFAKPDPQ